MPKLKHLLSTKSRDESQGRNEPDAAYLARMVRENATRQNFSALTFRFCYGLGLGLHTAELARIIAGNAGGYTSLDRYSELSLSAASVYMASHVCRVPRTLADIVGLIGVSADVVHTAYTKIFREQERLRDAEWRDIFGGSPNLSAAQIRRTLPFPPLAS
ncbi:hypothetical protein IMSHALPRED_004050 [Imshaugia aleurites]|uniref:Transcription factor TFIIB cyclin-like domain-containing protein n=1 Tax=Imshaugia aleurites TaxID=172621 RepID=A0A8H3EGC9_9LECA|nr:hypothetical protein IMSHALPRED_004050 [Imshaugia aleurites]